MTPIDNWVAAARQLNEDTRSLAKSVTEAFAALNEILRGFDARLSALEAASDTGGSFAVGDRVTNETGRTMYGEGAHRYQVTERDSDGGVRVYTLDDWLHISGDNIEEEGWQKA